MNTTSYSNIAITGILSTKDYYPFGSPIAKRAYSSGAYRYGFQAQEKDDEFSGEGNMVSYKYRIHDTRLGRFLSVDPLTPQYPWNSCYAFAENRVIDGIDLEGKEWKSEHKWSDKITDEKHIQTLKDNNIYKEGMTYKDAYDAYSPILLKKYENAGKKADCADLVYEAVIDVAEMFKLPIYFKGNRKENESTVYDNDNMIFKTKDELIAAVQTSFGASDLAAQYGTPHTIKKAKSDISNGSILTWQYSNGTVHHAAIVTNVETKTVIQYSDDCLIPKWLQAWTGICVTTYEYITNVTTISGNQVWNPGKPDNGKPTPAKSVIYSYTNNIEANITNGGNKEESKVFEWNFDNFDKNK